MYKIFIKKLTSNSQIANSLNIVDLAHVLALILGAELVDSERVVGSVGLAVVLEAVKDLGLVLVPSELAARLAERARELYAAVLFVNVFVLQSLDKLFWLLF